MTDDVQIAAAALEEERKHEKRWMVLVTIGAVLLFVFAFRACDSEDYQDCISVSGDHAPRAAADCRAAGWP